MKLQKKLLISEITKILNTMNLPEIRKDLSKDTNLRWLLRNMWIDNGGHKDLIPAFKAIKDLLQGNYT